MSWRPFLRRAAPAFVLLTAGACTEEPRDGPLTQPPAAPASAPMLDVRYRDVTAETGIDFVHENGSFGKKWLPETMGSGAALFDADGDGDLDVYFVNQRRWPGREADYASPASRPATPRLYVNGGGLRFEDLTDARGLARSITGMGAAAGDVNGDGREDLVVTALGDTQLFVNIGDRFEESARESGILTPRWRDAAGAEHPMWGTAAVLFDYDRDGTLDLFVAAYVQWSEATDIFTTLDGKTKAFTTPDLYTGDSSRLYRGLGAGRFADVTAEAGLYNPSGKSLGAAVADLDDDGFPELVVANDTQPNFLYKNDAGRFRDMALDAGIAYDANGRARAGMGIDITPWKGPSKSGRGVAIAIGNFSREACSFYVQGDGARFTDEAGVAGLALATYEPLTFGLVFLDADLDGRLDMALANGHIEPDIAAMQKGIAYAQPPQLFANAGGVFREARQALDSAAAAPRVGRGLAAGDLDGDGDPDLVLTQNGGRASLLRCDREGEAVKRSFLKVVLEGRSGNPRAIGAVVRATFAGRTEERWVRTGSSYLSQSETGVTVGLGAANRVDKLEVRWPWGGLTTLSDVPASAVPLRVRP